MPIYAKTPLGLLCDQINAVHHPKIPLTTDNVRVKTVVSIPAKDTSQPNSKVTLAGRQSHGLTGDITFSIRRLDLATLFKNQPPGIYSERSVTYQTAVRLLNAEYGLNLDPADFSATSMTGVVSFVLSPGVKSLQYKGQVTVKVLPMIRDLGRLRVRFLDELVHPTVVDGRRSADLLSWNWDLSNWWGWVTALPAGKVVASGALTRLVEQLKTMGLPDVNLTGATVTHYTATSQVATANQQYARVTLISGIDDPNLVGTLYLHYYV